MLSEGQTCTVCGLRNKPNKKSQPPCNLAKFACCLGKSGAFMGLALM